MILKKNQKLSEGEKELSRLIIIKEIESVAKNPFTKKKPRPRLFHRWVLSNFQETNHSILYLPFKKKDKGGMLPKSFNDTIIILLK